jgi:hypothetical protein
MAEACEVVVEVQSAAAASAAAASATAGPPGAMWPAGAGPTAAIGSSGGVQSLGESAPPDPERSSPAVAFAGRIIAMLLLPLSIAPVLLLGPSLLRAPVTLAHEGWGDVQRLERRLDPERPYHPPPPAAPGPSVWQAQVSLGSIYGRWSEVPGEGRRGITWRGVR